MKEIKELKEQLEEAQKKVSELEQIIKDKEKSYYGAWKPENW